MLAPSRGWDWYASGRVVDIAIAFTLLELLALLAYHHVSRRGLAPQDYALNVVSGLFLMLALRAALLPLWEGMAACLIAAGVAHIRDLVLRARRRA